MNAFMDGGCFSSKRDTELFTRKYDVALYFAACEERLAQV